MPLTEKVGETLAKPTGALLALGPLSFLSGWSLVIVIPVLLIMGGVGILFIMRFLPFILAGIMFLGTYWLSQKIGLKEPYNLIFPIVLTVIGSIPLFVGDLRSLALGQATAMVGASAMVKAQAGSVALSETGVWMTIAFTSFVSIGGAVSQKLKNWWPLIIGLAIFWLGIIFLVDQGAELGASMVTAAGTGISISLLADPVFYLLVISITVMSVVSLWIYKKR